MFREVGARVQYVSKKPGHVILSVELGGKRLILWIRAGGVKRESMSMFNRIVKDMEHDGIILVKCLSEPDNIKLPQDWVVLDISEYESDNEAARYVMEYVMNRIGSD